MILLNVKNHPGFGRNREVNSISCIWVASAIIAAAISGVGCSSGVESVGDWRAANSSPYALFQYSPANISDTSASLAYGSLEDDPSVVRSGYTDPRWERADEAFSPATNNRVLEIPRVLDRQNTAATSFR
jgi:hypothetical protein